MDPEERSGRVPAGAPARLKPVDLKDEFLNKKFLAEIVAELNNSNGFDRQERKAEANAREQLQRRLQDQDLFNELAQAGFTGPRYELFRAELAAYAFPVLRSWMRRGIIFRLAKDRGRPIGASDKHKAVLAEDYELREELAGETICSALNFFRVHALLGDRSRWTLEGGATLLTYFMNACIMAFQTVCRSWLRDQRKWDRNGEGYGLQIELEEPTARPMVPAIDADPGEAVSGDQWVYGCLNSLSPTNRQTAGRLVLFGDRYAEIGEDLGISERAVEGRIYRIRTELARRRAAKGTAL